MSFKNFTAFFLLAALSTPVFAETNTVGEQPLPGWENFEKVFGDDEDAREKFALLYAHDPEFLKTAESNPAQAKQWWQKSVWGGAAREQGKTASPLVQIYQAKLLGIRRQSDLESLYGRIVRTNTLDQYEEPFKAYFTELFSEACDVDQGIDAWKVRDLWNVMRGDETFRAELMEKLLRPAVVKAVEKIENSDSLKENEQNLTAVLTLARMKPGYNLPGFELPEALPAAVRTLKSSEMSDKLRASAALVVGMYGTKENIPSLELLIGNTTEVMKVKDFPVTNRVTDMVLASIVHLNGDDLRDYGFSSTREALGAPRGKLTPRDGFNLGFSSETRRQNAIQMWKSNRAEQF